MRAVVYSYKYYEGKKINASKETEQKKRKESIYRIS